MTKDTQRAHLQLLCIGLVASALGGCSAGQNRPAESPSNFGQALKAAITAQRLPIPTSIDQSASTPYIEIQESQANVRHATATNGTQSQGNSALGLTGK